MNLSILIVSLFTLNSFSLGYGPQRDRKKCDQYDPPAIRNVNFDKIAGKWYLVRLKTQSTIKRERTTDSTAEWIRGTDKAIRNVRLRHNPGYCSTILREFIPIPGTSRSAFSLFLEENNFTIEWRLLHYDSEYLITWGCFSRDKDNHCTDWASGVFRNAPDVVIDNKDMRRLDRISRRITCKTISGNYIMRTTTEECRDWGLRTRQKCY